MGSDRMIFDLEVLVLIIWKSLKLFEQHMFSNALCLSYTVTRLEQGNQ